MWTALLLLASLASAAELYVNGVRATGLRSQQFEDADVRIDEHGDIHITAPRYVVQSLEPQQPSAPSPQPQASAVTPGRYWLVTEDHRSSGHTVEVFANGDLVRRVRSGEPQVILDLSPWLTPGSNNITFSALPGPQPGGGALHIYMGTGYNDAGVIRLHDPQIDYVRRSSDQAVGGMSDHVLTVQ
jgi:hypothetical protein